MDASSGVAALRHLGLICIPFLLAAAPLLSFYRDNQTEVELGALWWPLFLLALVSAVLYGLFWLILREGAKAAVLASLGTVWFHFYGDYDWAPWVWTLLFVALCALVIVLGRPRLLSAIALGLAIWGLVLVVSPAIDVARYER